MKFTYQQSFRKMEKLQLALIVGSNRMQVFILEVGVRIWYSFHFIKVGIYIECDKGNIVKLPIP